MDVITYPCPKLSWTLYIGYNKMGTVRNWSDEQNHKRHHRADSRFVRSRWEMALLYNNVSHWMGASLESALHHISYHYTIPNMAVELNRLTGLLLCETNISQYHHNYHYTARCFCSLDSFMMARFLWIVICSTNSFQETLPSRDAECGF